MSPHGPSRPIAALQFFGRYWEHSGHRPTLEPQGSVAMTQKVTWRNADASRGRPSRSVSICATTVLGRA